MQSSQGGHSYSSNGGALLHIFSRTSAALKAVDDYGSCLFVVLLFAVVVVSVIIARLSYHNDAESWDRSTLFQSVDKSSLEEVRSVSIACVCLGLIFAMSGITEVIALLRGEESDRPAYRRLKARNLVFRLLLICAVIVTRVPILIVSSDENWPLRLADIDADGARNLCRSIVYVMQFEGLYIGLAGCVFFVDKATLTLKPQYALPVMLAFSAVCLLKQVLDTQQDAPTALVGAFRAASWVLLTIPVFVLAFITEKLVGIMAVRWGVVFRAWPLTELARRCSDPGNDLDAVVVMISISAFVMWKNRRGDLQFSLGFSAARARDMDVQFFVYSESVAACILLVLVTFMSVNVTARRVEQQQRKREEMLALDADVSRIFAVLTSIVPPRIARQLIKGEEVHAERHEFAVIFFSGTTLYTH